MITNTQVPGNDLVLKQGAMRDIDSLSVVGYDNDSTLCVNGNMKHGECGMGNRSVITTLIIILLILPKFICWEPTSNVIVLVKQNS